jgi:hypothetical protein
LSASCGLTRCPYRASPEKIPYLGRKKKINFGVDYRERPPGPRNIKFLIVAGQKDLSGNLS